MINACWRWAGSGVRGGVVVVEVGVEAEEDDDENGNGESEEDRWDAWG